VLALLALLAVSGCMTPSRTDRDFELKAGSSAKAVASSVSTALLAVEAARRHHATGNYLSVLLGNAEKDASSVQSQFDGVQPPSVKADAMRARLDALLSQAVDGLAQLRITARRGQLDRLPEVGAPLHEVHDELQALSEDWQ
jgi:hypothetical protein